ncbi:hypothetical protein F511_04268 [Dorcoceras hygrometricum]|uniref:Uncharacterized protein n=1 Tax=Dorcoceras hygrometricum TaxID=472368 RepID=A0A2Z7CSA3_9LAMI|nr:hypothetical protein F511_04268 [Dorcoceras hygrometricum]
MQGTPSWFTSLEQEQHEDQAKSNKKRDLKRLKKQPAQRPTQCKPEQRKSGKLVKEFLRLLVVGVGCSEGSLQSNPSSGILPDFGRRGDVGDSALNFHK